jgi:hypothetical protein
MCVYVYIYIYIYIYCIFLPFFCFLFVPLTFVGGIDSQCLRYFSTAASCGSPVAGGALLIWC